MSVDAVSAYAQLYYSLDLWMWILGQVPPYLEPTGGQYPLFHLELVMSLAAVCTHMHPAPALKWWSL